MFILQNTTQPSQFSRSGDIIQHSFDFLFKFQRFSLCCGIIISNPLDSRKNVGLPFMAMASVFMIEGEEIKNEIVLNQIKTFYLLIFIQT